MRKIIILHGKKRVGKDYFYKIARSTQNFTRLALADPLKRHVAETYDLTLEELEHLKDTATPESVLNFRKILQNQGDLMRNIYGRDYYVDLLIKKIKSTEGNVIVTDVRYLNELSKLCENFDCICIKIIRRSREGKEVDLHSSEVGIIDDFFNFVLYNNDDGKYPEIVAKLIKEIIDVNKKGSENYDTEKLE